MQKTAELIEMLFGGLTHVDPGNCVLDRYPDLPGPIGTGTFQGRHVPDIVMYLRMSALHVVCCCHGRMYHVVDKCIRCSEGCQDGCAAFCQITLNTCQSYLYIVVSNYVYIGRLHWIYVVKCRSFTVLAVCIYFKVRVYSNQVHHIML